MSSMKKFVHMALLPALSAALFATSAQAAELSGFALMPANAFSRGPTSGQFAGPGAGGNALPLLNKQPVQGVSAVLHGPIPNTFRVMADNGFGAKTNSADTLLRLYAVRPDFKTWNGQAVVGSGAVWPVNYWSGHVLPRFNAQSFITLRDPNHRVGFDITADHSHYPNGNNDIPVAKTIQQRRLLTGYDFDLESVRQDSRGHLWFGEEFGPFLLETSANGRVLRAEFRLPNVIPPGSSATGVEVMAPQNPHLAGATPNLPTSRGFEGMAINPAGTRLYTLLEGTVNGDNTINASTNKILRINEFRISTRRYTNTHWLYQMENDGTAIGDMTAINDHQFLVLERNSGTATRAPAPFKKVYLIDIAGVASGGFVSKTELVDLMNLPDPHDLNADGSTTFTFPFVTIESVLPLDASTLLIINDNNYPATGGRDANSDNTEFLSIKLAQPLNLATIH